MLVESAISVFFGTPIGESFFLPEQVSAFPNSLLQSKSGFRISLNVVAVRSRLAATTRVYPGRQGAEFSVRHKPTVRCGSSASCSNVEEVGGQFP